MDMRRRQALRLTAGAGVVGALGAIPAAARAETTGAAAATARSKLSDKALVASLPGFRNGYATVNGVRLHYVVGGRGAPLMLLPGWPETWWEFHKIMPALAQRYRVIAVDLRGMGSSDKPEGGYDKKTMAEDVYQLARHLGYQRVNVAGHDLGSIVAFGFAATHPETAIRIAMLDVAYPDESWYQLSLIPRPGQQDHHPWWMAFNQLKVLPEQLLTGRSIHLINWKFAQPGALFNKDAVDDRDKSVYARAYDYPDAIRASNGWYQAVSQDILDLATFPVVRTPILAMHGDTNVQGPPGMLPGLQGRASDVTPLEIKNAGHYMPEDQPKLVIHGLTSFFG
jgi:pimeloyl-ACP methyl ester carboxylesterase